MKRQPNTLDCHRLILWAQSTGRAPQMKQRLMDLYFTEGADLSDREVLVRPRPTSASTPTQTREHAGERRRRGAGRERGQFRQGRRHRRRADLHPRRRRRGVSGAQTPEVLANAIEQIATNREQFLAEQRAQQTA